MGFSVLMMTLEFAIRIERTYEKSSLLPFSSRKSWSFLYATEDRSVESIPQMSRMNAILSVDGNKSLDTPEIGKEPMSGEIS